MLDHYRQTLQRQFGAAIAMLESAIRNCPDSLWNDASGGGPPFWRLAYHTLFYLDLYLGQNEASFRPADFHEENAQLFNLNEDWLPPGAQLPQTIYTRNQVLGYLEQCRMHCAKVVADLDERSLAQASGFEWLPFSRSELMLYNLRHVQHHAGQLGLLLRRRTGIENRWIGSQAL